MSNSDAYIGCYWLGYWINFAVTFIGCWIYCVATYGFLIGVGLGWLPSLITAAIISLAWPLMWLGILIVVATVMSK